jgi:deoxyribodipyrimidine photo-lyase
MNKENLSIFWFRRDLRINDNAALFRALSNNINVQPIFIFDKNILDKLEDKHDKRVEFIHHALEEVQKELIEIGSTIWIYYGEPLKVLEQLCSEYDVKNVFANHDYEPYAIARDLNIEKFLNQKAIEFFTCKDQCIFEKSEITKDDGSPYTIFTPYMRKWKGKISPFYLKSYPCENYYCNFRKSISKKLVSLAQIGFKSTGTIFPSSRIQVEQIEKYKEQRDFPAINGTSKLSVHLRFGTLSIREIASRAGELNETWLNELIWRDFYMMILWHFPHVVGNSFKPNYDRIEWRNNEQEFKAWCNGQTGYPIVDAGLREINETGFMHNRVRMVVASFLTKHLLIDWRWGEAYFAQKLIDFELSSNNGGWQWAAGSGCDAAPYFRVFNPYEQTKKFDHNFEYIKKWVPEYQSTKYPKPIVEHVFARNRVLATYKLALQPNEPSIEKKPIQADLFL